VKNSRSNGGLLRLAREGTTPEQRQNAWRNLVTAGAVALLVLGTLVWLVRDQMLLRSVHDAKDVAISEKEKALGETKEALKAREKALANTKQALTEKEKALSEKERAFSELRHAVKVLLALAAERASIPGLDPARPRLLNEAAQLCRALLDEGVKNPEALRIAGRTFHLLGACHKDFGENKEAEQMFGAAVKRFEELVDLLPEDSEARRYLASSLNMWGVELARKGKTGQAEAAKRFAQALSHLHHWGDKPPLKPGFLRDRAALRVNIVNLLRDEGQLKEAKVVALAARDDWELVVAQDDKPSTTHLDDQANSLLALSKVLELLGEKQEAIEGVREALAIEEGLAEKRIQDPIHRERHASALYQYAMLTVNVAVEASGRSPFAGPGLRNECQASMAALIGLAASGSTSNPFSAAAAGLTGRPYEALLMHSAESAHLKAEGLLRSLAAESPTRSVYRLRLANNLTGYGNLLFNARRFEESLVKHRQALDEHTKLLAHHPNQAEYREGRAVTLAMRARTFFYAGSLPEVRASCNDLDNAIDDLKRALESSPSQPTWRRFLREDYLALAQRRLLLKEHAAAAEAAKKITELYPDSAPQWSQAAKVLAECTAVAAGEISLSPEQQAKQAESYAATAKEYIHTARTKGATDWITLNDVAWLLAEGPAPQLRNPKQAVELAQRAVQLVSGLETLPPKGGLCWTTLGIAYYRTGMWQEAKAALESVPAARMGGAVRFLFLALTYQRLEDAPRSRQCYEQAIKAHRGSRAPNLQRLFEETEALLSIQKP
jgi:tetratricopeptide (TPR) repeat protein